MVKKIKKIMTSVIIPAYNATSTIFKCLEALEKQTLKPTEIIIVDDGSKDGLARKINKVRKQLKLQKIIILKQNHQGVSEARNLGAKKSHGEILVFIDSDCVPSIDWLKNIITPFYDRQVGAVGGGYNAGIDKSFWQIFLYEELFFRRRKRKGKVETLLSNNMAIRKDIFWKVGGFSKRYPVCEDMLISYQISRKYKIIWLKNNGVKHHFKNNIKAFLKHQYFFGKESTNFFLENPQVLLKNNHQGKRLYLAIGIAFLSIVGMLIFLFCIFLYKYLLNWLLIVGISSIFLTHLFLYWEFIVYLKKKKMKDLDILRAYVFSYCRDLIAAISFFDGLTLYIKERKL